MDRPTRSKRSTWLAVGLVLVPLAGGAGAYALRRAPAAPSPAVAGARGAAPFAAGEQRRWSLGFEARLADPSAKGPKPGDMSFTSEWVVTVVDDRADGYDVACQIVHPRVTGAGAPNVPAADIAAFERRLSQPFFVSYRADGTALEMHFPRALDAGARNLLQLVVTDTQLVRPAQPAPRWTAVERDGTGSYLAAYREEAPGRLIKNKLKYLSVDPSTGARGGSADPGVDIAVESSVRQLMLDASGGLVAFEGGDTIRVALPMSDEGLAMRVSVRLSNLSRARAAELVGALARERADLDTTAVVTHAPSEEQAQASRDARLLAGTDLDAILRDVRATPAEGRAPEQLEAWLRVHPEASDAVAAEARRAPPGAAAKAFTAALGRAATPAAQAALVVLGRDARLAAQLRSDALVGLMFGKAPTRATMQAVAALGEDREPVVRRAALFVAGSLARAARPEGSPEADAIDRALLAAYAAAKDAPARAEVLGAFGNSAGPSLLPRIREALASDPASPVRAAAVRALRIYEDAEVKELLARTITSDRDPAVRSAAIFAAGFAFEARYVEPLTRVALADPVEYVRGDATNMLASHRDVTPEIADTLERVADKDPKPGIRKLARAALTQHAAR